MNEQIIRIAKDLALLKKEMPETVMIGQLKISNKQLALIKRDQEISWSLKKRTRGNQDFYRVKFDDSNCVLEALMISTTTEISQPIIPISEDQSVLSITRNEINDFLLAVDDPNTLHRGENPVVPGLLLLDSVLTYESEYFSQVDSYLIRFIKPLFADLLFTIRRDEKTIIIESKMGDCIAIVTMEENNE